jgi:hypothetical protein
MAQQIQFRRGTSTEWFVANPILAQGELGIDLDVNRFKIGTGVTSWNSLNYTAVFDVVIQSPAAPIVYPTFANASGVSAIGIASTGSTSVVYIPSSGNFGIGTTDATSKLTVAGDLLVTGIITASAFSGDASIAQLNVSGIATLGVTSATNLTAQQLNVSGITTLGVTSVTNLTAQQLNVSGITTLGVTSTTNLTSRQLNVSGITTLGILTVGNIYSSGIITATDFNSASDIKLKENVQRIDNPIDKIIKIDGVRFDWKSDNKPSMGVIAQNIEEVLPELVNGEESKTVNYNGIIGLLIECVKTQQEQIDELNKRLDDLTK